MKLYAPAYYKNFTCIAGQCRHSCCIGWEIDVDDTTMQIYDSLTEGYGNAIQDSISKDPTPHFRLCADDSCPHLDEQGLCRIITNLGEGYLCHICREHPRFYNDTNRGAEVGLGMACEEACRLILTSDDYANIMEIGEMEGGFEESNFDPLPYREQIYALLSDHSISYTERLHRLGKTYGVDPINRPDDEWQALLMSLEYLYDDHKAAFAVFSSNLTTPSAWEAYLERALAYFIYRHLPSAWDKDDLCAAVGFALFCERLIASIVRAEEVCDLESFIEIARVVSEELEYSEDNTDAIKIAFSPTAD